MNVRSTQQVSEIQDESDGSLPSQALGACLPTPLPGMALLASYLRFARAGLLHQRQTGALIPSQRFLMAAMAKPIPRDYTGQIIELGTGTGSLTRRLALRCPGARIVACEINPNLAAETRAVLQRENLEHRVELYQGAAESLLRRWESGTRTKPGYIVSGIPLGSQRGAMVCKLLDAIRKALSETGCFIQFQYSLLDRRRIQDRFRVVRTVPVAINIPPAVVYIARP